MDQATPRTSRICLFLAGLTLLTACGEQGGGTWFREAGSQLDNGEYGNAIMQNMIAQVCFPNGRTNAIKGGKFGTTVGDPVVVLDPSSTRRNPVFRVHCDGQLDGKFAQVVYRDYIRNAGQDITVTEATAE